MLANLLNKELEQMGHKMSIRRMFDMFQEAQQIISVFSLPNDKSIEKISYSRFKLVNKEYDRKYGLLKYLN
jgi:hypothetical protein